VQLDDAIVDAEHPAMLAQTIKKYLNRKESRIAIVRRKPWRERRIACRRPRRVTSFAAMPDLMLENACGGLVCGIDEVGRGPLAGPVVAAAVILDLDHMPRGLRRAIDDSKALTAEQRAECDGELRRCALIGLGAASVREIDTINILRASLKAMQRAVRALGIRPDHALVDGAIPPALPCPVQTVVGGDGKSLSIAAASIVAKVTRDRLMRELARRYGGYGWETNVGYATREHYLALGSLGATIHHRRSFAPVRLALAGGCLEPELPLSYEQPVNPLTQQND
jgi:ribonuclease HII